MDKISKIVVSLDSHTPHQIFHSSWWVDKNNQYVKPFTSITLDDLNSGKYRAVIDPISSRDYIKNLEKLNKKSLTVWPYHCIKGTPGSAIENQLSNMLYFYSIAKKSPIEILIKGEDPATEMYGIFKAERSKKKYY